MVMYDVTSSYFKLKLSEATILTFKSNLTLESQLLTTEHSRNHIPEDVVKCKLSRNHSPITPDIGNTRVKGLLNRQVSKCIFIVLMPI